MLRCASLLFARMRVWCVRLLASRRPLGPGQVSIPRRPRANALRLADGIAGRRCASLLVVAGLALGIVARAAARERPVRTADSTPTVAEYKGAWHTLTVPGTWDDQSKGCSHPAPCWLF